MALLLIPPRIRFVDDNGDPLAAGKVYTYAAGTSTPKTTWSDEAETSSNANPVILDARGEAVIRLAGSYKIDVHDSNDVQLSGYPVDDVTEWDVRDWSGLTATIADLNSTTTTAINKNLDYSIILTDRGKTVLADSTAAKLTVTLLPAVTATNRYRITIKKANISDSTKPVEILASGIETIDGVSSLNLYDIDDYLEVLCDGSNWRIVSGQIRGATLPITAATTITFDDHQRTYLCDASGGAFDFTLLPSTTVGDGFKIRVKKIDSSANAVTIKPDGSETIDGAADLALKKQYDSILLINNGANWFALSEYGEIDEGGLPKDYRSGVLLSNNVTDTQHDIDFATGKWRSSDDTTDLILSALMTKRIDANWVAGTGNGGFPTGITLTANTWYHCFLIGKTDGTTDAGFDSDINATNLLVDAVDYTKFRRVGSVKTEAATTNLLQFVMYYIGKFRETYWTDPTLEVNTTNPGIAAVLPTVKTPLGVSTLSICNFVVDGGVTELVYVSNPAQSDLSPSRTAAPLAQIEADGHGHPASIEVITNTSSQIRYRFNFSDGGTVIRISTIGWKE